MTVPAMNERCRPTHTHAHTGSIAEVAEVGQRKWKAGPHGSLSEQNEVDEKDLVRTSHRKTQRETFPERFRAEALLFFVSAQTEGGMEGWAWCKNYEIKLCLTF